MKKFVILLFSLIFIGLISCNEKQLTRDEIVKRDVEELVLYLLDDRNSYELLRFVLIDSVTFSDNISIFKSFNASLLKRDSLTLARHKLFKKNNSRNYSEEEEKNAEESFNEGKKIIEEINSIENELGDRKDEIASYTYSYSFRGENIKGVLRLKKIIIQTDPAPEYKIINMASKLDELIYAPNAFPGYHKISNMGSRFNELIFAPNGFPVDYEIFKNGF